MSNRTKLIIIGVIVLIVIILILIFLPGRGREPEQTVVTEVGNMNEPAAIQEEATKPEPVPLSEEKAKSISASTVATIFVERFGSYSTESNLDNIEDVLLITTPTYRSKLEQIIADGRASAPSDTYYGVTTRVISVRANSVNNGEATMEVQTQREESVGSVQNSSVKYQTIMLELRQINDEWLVHDAIWQ